MSMHIRTFRAANINEALQQIKSQMGPDATVLHTRQVPRGLLGFLQRQRIEVTAGLKTVQQERDDTDDTNDLLQAKRAVAGNRSQEAGHHFEQHSSIEQHNSLEQRCIDDFVERGVPASIARYWMSQVAVEGPSISLWKPLNELRESERVYPEEDLRRRLSRWFQQTLGPGRAIALSGSGQRIVALVGATGVGKTTTIAKLAAQFRLKSGARVGLLTMDCFRAAAFEQMDCFARAMKAPLEVVRGEEDIVPCLQRLAECALVLVDTIGQSPRGDERLGLLDRWLRAIQPHETHLVIDANCSLAAARACFHAFSALRPTACILSKVDEVSCAAPALAALLGSRIAMSYVTNGQLVPDDLLVADTAQLANWLSGIAAGGVSSVISSPMHEVA